MIRMWVFIRLWILLIQESVILILNIRFMLMCLKIFLKILIYRLFLKVIESDLEQPAKQESLLELQTGQAFLNVFNSERGKVYLFAVPFQTSFSNFPKHAVFVPTMYKIAVSSVIEDNLYYTIGENEVITVRNINLGVDNVLSIRDQQTEFEFIPEHRRVNSHLDIFPHGQIKLAGNYTL